MRKNWKAAHRIILQLLAYYIMYHRHQSCKVQVSISGHDDDERFDGSKTAHAGTSAQASCYAIAMSKRYLCDGGVFSALELFVCSFTDFVMCARPFLFIHPFRPPAPHALYLLHYFSYFFPLSTFLLCVCLCVIVIANMAFRRYTQVLGYNNNDDDDDDDHGPRWQGEQHGKSRGKNTRTREKNIFAMA